MTSAESLEPRGSGMEGSPWGGGQGSQILTLDATNVQGSFESLLDLSGPSITYLFSELSLPTSQH